MGSNAEAVAIYRIALGVMLLVELTTRFQYLHPFYSDEGWESVLCSTSFDVWALVLITFLSMSRLCPSSTTRTLPLRLLMPKTDSIYKMVCIHCYSGSMIYMRTLLSFQVILATMFLVGYKTRMASIGSWFLYFSLTLRNTWLNFILDRWVLVAHAGPHGNIEYWWI